MTWKLSLIVAIAPALMPAQALVEYGLAAAAAGNAGAASHSVGNAIGGIMTSLSKSLDSAGESAAAAPASFTAAKTGASAKAASAQPKPAIVYEDAAGIQPQMERAEMVRRFGEPSMNITAGPGRESMIYASKAGTVEVEVRDGKVATVQCKATPKQSAVVVLN